MSSPSIELPLLAVAPVLATPLDGRERDRLIQRAKALSWLSLAYMTAEGAIGITAAILPRTRACRGPWAAWRGYAMPAALLSAYEEAAEHEQKGRYDAALERYLAALKLDPTNVQVRLHLAQLEEKLGLFLKALASYQSIHALSHPGSGNLPRGLYRRGARREWDRAQQIAKYRELVMLGEGSIIAQWSATARGEKLPEATRASLREEFEKRLRPLTIPRGDPVADAISCAILTLLEADRSLSAAAERELTCRLGRWAYRGSEALRRSLPGTLLMPRDYPLTRTTVGLSMACIRRRYELAAGADLVDDDGRPVKPTIGLAQRLERQIAWAHWRTGPWKAHWTPPQLRRQRWHEHYNAACLYSIALIPTYARSLPRPCYKELAERAVRHLELATATAESSFVDTRRDWVLERDHDLIGLRQRWQFEAFASVYFPDEAPTRRVVVPYPRLAESRYTRTLLATLARSWHDVWHARAAAPWDVHLALD